MNSHDFTAHSDEFLTKFCRMRERSRLVSITVAVLVPLALMAKVAGISPAPLASLVLAMAMAGAAYILWAQIQMRRWLSSHGLICTGCKRPLVYQDRAALIASRACGRCRAAVLQ